MTKRPTLNVLILSAALLIGAGPYLVRAADRQANAGITANVDMQRVYSESDARTAALTRAFEYNKSLHAKFEQIAGLKHLTRDEIQDLSDALTRENPTPADKTKADSLTASAGKRAAEVQALSLKKEADLTQADKARFRELNTMEQEQPKVMDQLRFIYERMVAEEEAKQIRIGVGEVRAIVSKIAKDQGITEVFDTSSMVYAPIDLTAASLPKVKKKPAGP